MRGNISLSFQVSFAPISAGGRGPTNHPPPLAAFPHPTLHPPIHPRHTTPTGGQLSLPLAPGARGPPGCRALPAGPLSLGPRLGAADRAWPGHGSLPNQPPPRPHAAGGSCAGRGQVCSMGARGWGGTGVRRCGCYAALPAMPAVWVLGVASGSAAGWPPAVLCSTAPKLQRGGASKLAPFPSSAPLAPVRAGRRAKQAQRGRRRPPGRRGRSGSGRAPRCACCAMLWRWRQRSAWTRPLSTWTPSGWVVVTGSYLLRTLFCGWLAGW